MTDFTAEVVKMEFANLMGTLPTYFKTINAQLAEAFSIEQETMQTLLEWDMLTQIETLNTNIIDNFTLQNESFLTLFEGLKEYFTEAFALKDELFQLSMETLTTFLSESFAVGNELSAIQMEGLLTYLAESFAIRNELSAIQMEGLLAYLNELFTIRNDLSRILMDSLVETLMMLVTAQQNFLSVKFNDLVAQITANFSMQWELLTLMTDLLLSQMIINFELLNMISALISNGTALIITSIGTATSAIISVCTLISTGINNIGTLFIGYITSFSVLCNALLDAIPKITSDKYDIKAINLAQKANSLATIGNALTLFGNGLAARGNALAEKANELTHAGNQMTAIGLGLDIGSFLVDLFIPFADGGIPGYGELFVAREAGPEFVGSFGSRNVVMNNDQIVAAVSGGVYDAVRRANAEQTQQPIYLNVEAKVRENVLFDMMETVKAERGVRLATGGAW